MTWTYRVYGTTIALPFPCPSLAPAQAPPDVVCSPGTVPVRLEGAEAEDRWWQASAGRFLYRGGRRVGRFLVDGPDRVIVQLPPDPDPERLAFAFTHTVLAAVLRHRGLLVLHAAAAVCPAGATAVGGRSGSGKSTALANLLGRGWRMLTDDVTVLRLDAAGFLEALPGPSVVHLSERAARDAGVDADGLPRRPWHRMKIPIRLDPWPRPARLASLCLLDVGETGRVRVEPLRGAARFAGLREMLYGPMLSGEQPAALPALAAASRTVRVARVTRPAGVWSAGEVAEAIAGG